MTSYSKNFEAVSAHVNRLSTNPDSAQGANQASHGIFSRKNKAKRVTMRICLAIAAFFFICVSGLYAQAGRDSWSGKLSVDVMTEKHVVKLNWQTAGENEVDFFTIENSIDGVTFEKLTVVDGSGNSSSAKEYSFVDENPIEGLSYYRLCQTNLDGDIRVLKIVAVQFYDHSDDLTVYPNPATSDSFTIDSRLEDEQAVVTIHDVYGREVMTSTLGWGKNLIALDNLRQNSNMYFIKVYGHSGQQILSKKLLTR